MILIKTFVSISGHKLEPWRTNNAIVESISAMMTEKRQSRGCQLCKAQRSRYWRTHLDDQGILHPDGEPMIKTQCSNCVLKFQI